MSAKKIAFITGNKDKFEEAKAVIPDLIQEDIDLPEIQNIDSRKVIEEKLKEAKKKVKGNIIVEDVSLSLDVLNGLPGPLIKWFLKTIGNDGLVKIANSFGNFNATAKVTIGLLEESGKEKYFEGEAKGKIVEPRGENGFGFDPIFEIEGVGKTFAEMTSGEKNQVSMRKMAFQKLSDYLQTQ